MVIDFNDESIVRWQDALTRLGDNEKLLYKVLHVFAEDTPKQVAKLLSSMDKDDIDSAERYAHSLKGAAANISAEMMRDTAYAVEMALKDNDKARAEELFGAFEKEFDRVITLLRQG